MVSNVASFQDLFTKDFVYHIQLDYGAFVFKRMPIAGTFSLELVLGISYPTLPVTFFFCTRW